MRARETLLRGIALRPEDVKTEAEHIRKLISLPLVDVWGVYLAEGKQVIGDP